MTNDLTEAVDMVHAPGILGRGPSTLCGKGTLLHAGAYDSKPWPVVSCRECIVLSSNVEAFKERLAEIDASLDFDAIASLSEKREIVRPVDLAEWKDRKVSEGETFRDVTGAIFSPVHLYSGTLGLRFLAVAEPRHAVAYGAKILPVVGLPRTERIVETSAPWEPPPDVPLPLRGVRPTSSAEIPPCGVYYIDRENALAFETLKAVARKAVEGAPLSAREAVEYAIDRIRILVTREGSAQARVRRSIAALRASIADDAATAALAEMFDEEEREMFLTLLERASR